MAITKLRRRFGWYLRQEDVRNFHQLKYVEKKAFDCILHLLSMNIECEYVCRNKNNEYQVYLLYKNIISREQV